MCDILVYWCTGVLVYWCTGWAWWPKQGMDSLLSVKELLGLMMTGGIGNCVSPMALDDRLVNLLAGHLPKNQLVLS